MIKQFILIIIFQLPVTFTQPSAGDLSMVHKMYIGKLLLLTKLLNSEAIGQSYEEKLRAGSVVINRVNDTDFPNTIEGVIFQKNQFKGIYTKHFRLYSSIKGKESFKAARFLLQNGSILPSNVVYFHNPYVGKDKRWMSKIKHKLYFKGDKHWYFYK